MQHATVARSSLCPSPAVAELILDSGPPGPSEPSTSREVSHGCTVLLLASAGAIVVDDLVVENTGTSTIAVLNHPITGYRDGLLLAMAAALGLVIGLLVVGSLSMRRTRRAHRTQLRRIERELSSQLLELERENIRLRDELARRDSAARRLAGVPAAADLEPPGAARRPPSPLADREVELIYEEARRVARLRSDSDLPFLSSYTRSGTA
jgi:uncharacterized membrane protein YccC